MKFATRALIRRLGWLSLSSGALLLLLPRSLCRLYGLPSSRLLGRLLGARDLVIGARLLEQERSRSWLLARGCSDAADLALILITALSGAKLGPLTVLRLGLATAASWLGFTLAASGGREALMWRAPPARLSSLAGAAPRAWRAGAPDHGQ